MEIKLNRANGLDATLTVDLEPQDYEKEIQNGLREYRKQINLPGFRKGKVPLGVVKNLALEELKKEKIPQIINTSVQNYLKENDLKLILNPLEINPKKEINWKEEKDFHFEYDVGLKPEITFSKDDFENMEIFKITVSDEDIDKEIELLQKQLGKYDKMDEVKEDENTIVYLYFKELDDEGNELDGGLNKFQYENLNKLPKDFIKELIGKKEGDTFKLNIKKAFNDNKALADFLEESELTIDDLSDEIQIDLKNVFSFKKAELDETFFNGLFPDKEIKTEEEFRNEIKEILEQRNNLEADRFLFSKMQEKVKDETSFELPEHFMKRWHDSLHEGHDHSHEETEAEFDRFKKDMKWMLTVDKLVEDFDIKVEENEILEFAKATVENYLRQQTYQEFSDEDVLKYTYSYLKEQGNYFKVLYTVKENKLFDELKNNITFKEKVISRKEFDELKEKETQHSDEKH